MRYNKYNDKSTYNGKSATVTKLTLSFTSDFPIFFYRYNKNHLFNRIIIIKKSCFHNCGGLSVKIFLFYAL